MSQTSRAKQDERNKRYIKSKDAAPILVRVLDKATLAEPNEKNPQKITVFSNGTIQQLTPNGSLRTIGQLKD